MACGTGVFRAAEGAPECPPLYSYPDWIRRLASFPGRRLREYLQAETAKLFDPRCLEAEVLERRKRCLQRVEKMRADYDRRREVFLHLDSDDYQVLCRLPEKLMAI